MKKNKWLAAALSFTLLIPTLTACSTGKDSDSKEERTLRIASSVNYGDDGSYFRQQFTEIFEYANPNIKLEFVPTVDSGFMYGYGKTEEGQPPEQPDPFKNMKEAMEGPNPPDIVMFNLNEIKPLLEENLLTPLDPMIAKDKFDTSDIVPAVLDGLKSASSDGKLYALSPVFTSSALIYNKKIFDDAGVPYPTDNMTWDEMFDLARRVSNPDAEHPVYGFNFYSQAYSDLYGASNVYTAPLGLRIFDDKAEKMTVDTNEWEQVWTKLIQLQKDKIVPGQPDPNKAMPYDDGSNPFAYDDFMSGRLAMTIMNYGELARIDNANKNADRIKGYTPVDYDVVTIPSHESAPGVVANIGLNGIMGINAKAANVEDAWRFLKFINGEDWARAKANNNYQLVSRKKYIKKDESTSFHIEAFYNIKPVINSPQDNWRIYQEKPGLYQVTDMGRNEFNQALQGGKSVRDALKAWQTQGDQLLQQIKENPSGNPVKPMDGAAG